MRGWLPWQCSTLRERMNRQSRETSGPAADKLTTGDASVPRTGFETDLRTTTSQRYLAARALGSPGRVLASSVAISRETPSP